MSFFTGGAQNQSNTIREEKVATAAVGHGASTGNADSKLTNVAHHDMSLSPVADREYKPSLTIHKDSAYMASKDTWCTSSAVSNNRTVAETDSKSPEKKKRKYRIICQCGSTKCRKYLF